MHGRACETPWQRDVRPALPRSEGHDGEPALDGVHLAQRLGGVQWTVEGLTRASGDRQTTGAPGLRRFGKARVLWAEGNTLLGGLTSSRPPMASIMSLFRRKSFS